MLCLSSNIKDVMFGRYEKENEETYFFKNCLFKTLNIYKTNINLLIANIVFECKLSVTETEFYSK